VTFTKTITRAAIALALALPLAIPAAPAFAGQKEVSFMQTLAGNFTGSGKISGENGGTANCRMSLTPSGQKLNFRGRCSLAGGGGSQSFSGSIRYDDKAGRWVSSGNGSTVVGKRSGNSLTFTTSQNTSRGKVSSTMTLSRNSLKVQFSMVSRSGDKSAGTVPFSRA
jgi:hypothetical protein